VNQQDADILHKLQDEILRCKLCGGSNLTCECYKKYFSTLSIITAGIPLKYRSFTFDDFNSVTLRKSVNKLKNYIEMLDKNKSNGTGLYLFGNSGTGKTSLGCLVMLEALKHGYSCYFCVVDQYRKSLFESNSEVLDKIRNSQFLMIDDIGREFQDSKGFIESYLDDLVRHRTDNLTPTIITSNLSESTATDSFRMASIIKEHFLVIEFTNVDYRKTIRDTLNAKA